MIDRARFFAAARAHPFDGTMSQAQVDGCSAILDEWERRAWPDIRWLAYMLSTPFLETNRTMQPVREAYYLNPPAQWAAASGKAEAYRRTLRYFPFYGRGLVQITWEDNYRRFSPLVGVDLVAEPDRTLEPATAVKIMFEGMSRGLFTGVGLGRYFNPTTDDPENARRIINGTDRAAELAVIHGDFLAALKAAA